MALLDVLLHAKQLDVLRLVQGSGMVDELYQRAISKGLIRYTELHQEEFLPVLRTLRSGGCVTDVSLLKHLKQLKAPTLSEVVVHGRPRWGGDDVRQSVVAGEMCPDSAPCNMLTDPLMHSQIPMPFNLTIAQSSILSASSEWLRR